MFFAFCGHSKVSHLMYAVGSQRALFNEANMLSIVDVFGAIFNIFLKFLRWCFSLFFPLKSSLGLIAVC